MPQFESDYEAKLYNDRRASLEKLAALGEKLGLTRAEATFPNSFPFTHTLAQLRQLGLDNNKAPLSAEALEATPIEAAIAGRLVAHRQQGKAGFAQLQQEGQRLQLYVRKDDVGVSPEQSETLFELYKLLQIGDIIGVRGTLMRTRTGELTLKAHAIHLPGQQNKPALQLLTKAMLALPDKYHGLEDVELRYRQRYVDLIMNSGASAASTQKSADIAQESAVIPHENAVILSEGGVPSERSLLGGVQAKDPRISSVAAQPSSEAQPSPLPVREVFVKRAAILRAIRNFFDARNYLEVETPMLHTIAGGAAARPFKTHHNALDIPLSLRIAPELYLKRLVVGGLDRVYEINRNFRNEGVSTQHNPEFTMLEFYQAYANYHDLMDLTQELITQVAQEVNGTTITNFNGTEIDLSKWTKLSMLEAIFRFWPEEYGPAPTQIDMDNARRFFYFVENYKLPGESSPVDGRFKNLHDAITSAREVNRVGENIGKHIAAIFEAVAEPHLIQPTIIYDFPLAVSPLSKVKPDEPDWVERFEFYIGGFEVGNAFSELNDPEDQRNRFLDQLKERDRGDDEAHAMDEDYVRALGYGLPPTAGEGIGIDRLTMILTGSRSIRDVILFPLMRPYTQPSEPADESSVADEPAT